MQAADNHREKYSNLIFFLFNALFLLAIFWMLPALGDDPARPATASRQSARPAGVSIQEPEKSSLMQTHPGGLFVKFIMDHLPRLPR